MLPNHFWFLVTFSKCQKGFLQFFSVIEITFGTRNFLLHFRIYHNIFQTKNLSKFQNVYWAYAKNHTKWNEPSKIIGMHLECLWRMSYSMQKLRVTIIWTAIVTAPLNTIELGVDNLHSPSLLYDIVLVDRKVCSRHESDPI